METKQKSWEECCNEVANKTPYGNTWEAHISNLGMKFFKEAAELFNQETAAERDSFKAGAEEWKATAKYYEDEINKLREERDQLKEENQKLKSNRDYFTRLQVHLVNHLKGQQDNKFLVSGRYSWTTHELAKQIEIGTQDGLEVVNRMLRLTIDLISRGKESLPESTL